MFKKLTTQQIANTLAFIGGGAIAALAVMISSTHVEKKD